MAIHRGNDIFVIKLLEMEVVVAKSAKMRRLRQAYDTIRFLTEFGNDLRRGDWQRDNDRSRRPPFESAYGHLHCCAGSGAIIDQNCCLAGDRERRPAIAIGRPSTLELWPLVFHQGGERRVVQSVGFHDFAVEDHVWRITVNERCNRKFRVAWGAHLADNNQIKWRRQRGSDLAGDRHAAAR